MAREDGDVKAKVKVKVEKKAVMSEGAVGGPSKTRVEKVADGLPEKATLVEQKAAKGAKGGRGKGDKGGAFDSGRGVSRKGKGGHEDPPPSKYDYDYNERQRRDEAKVEKFAAFNNVTNDDDAKPIMELLGAAQREHEARRAEQTSFGGGWDSFKGGKGGKDSGKGKGGKGGKGGDRYARTRGIEDFEDPLPMTPPKVVPAPIINADGTKITIFDEDLKECSVVLESEGLFLLIHIGDDVQKRTVESIEFSPQGDQVKFICTEKKWYVSLPDDYEHTEMLKAKITALSMKSEQQAKEAAEREEREKLARERAEQERKLQEEREKVERERLEQERLRAQQAARAHQAQFAAGGQAQPYSSSSYMQRPGQAPQSSQPYPQSSYTQQQAPRQMSGQQAPQSGYTGQSSHEAPLLNVRTGLSGGYGLYEGGQKQPGSQQQRQGPGSAYDEATLMRIRQVQQQEHLQQQQRMMQPQSQSGAQLALQQQQRLVQQRQAMLQQQQQQQQQQQGAAGRQFGSQAGHSQMQQPGYHQQLQMANMNRAQQQQHPQQAQMQMHQQMMQQRLLQQQQQQQQQQKMGSQQHSQMMGQQQQQQQQQQPYGSGSGSSSALLGGVRSFDRGGATYFSTEGQQKKEES